MNTGKRFENRFRVWHKDLENVLCIKYPDHASTGTFEQALCDFIIIGSGRVAFYELKHTNSKTSFSFSLIKDHQMKSMMKLTLTNNIALFLIEDGNGNVYIQSPSDLIIHHITGKKSIKFSDIENKKINKKQYLQQFS